MSAGRGRRQMAVRATTPQPDNRRRTLIVVLVVVMIVLVATVALVVGLGRPGPTGSPTPTGLAVSSASPTATVAPRTATPTKTQSAASPPTGQPTAAPSTKGPPEPTPVATALVDAPMREVVLTSLGIDNPVAPEATARRLTFNVDGRGDISAEVSDITAGLVQLCLWPGDGSIPPAAADCVVTPESRIERTPEVSGPWTLLLAGGQPGRSPSVTLVLRFPANVARVDLADFRFQGQNNPSYTGFDMKLTARADGVLDVTTAWDDGVGGSYPYILSVLDLSVEFEEPVVVEGTSDLAAASRPATDEHTYQITMTNLQESIIDAVFLRGTVTWP